MFFFLLKKENSLTFYDIYSAAKTRGDAELKLSFQY